MENAQGMQLINNNFNVIFSNSPEEAMAFMRRSFREKKYTGGVVARILIPYLYNCSHERFSLVAPVIWECSSPMDLVNVVVEDKLEPSLCKVVANLLQYYSDVQEIWLALVHFIGSEYCYCGMFVETIKSLYNIHEYKRAALVILAENYIGGVRKELLNLLKGYYQ